MLSKFHQNGVMHGCIHFFCLACEVILRTEEEADLHIDEPGHKTNFGKTEYVESFSGDCIRKVNKGYYCVCCNILLSNIIKIKTHIKEEKHEFNKTKESDGEVKESSFLKWVDNVVIAFDDLLIEEKAWNGLIDNTCLVCDVDFEDAGMHTTETGHNLKLIQSKVLIETRFLFRKIDDSDYQCLTCNIVVPYKELMVHVNKSEHTKLYLECRKAKHAFINKIGRNESKNKTVDEEEQEKVVQSMNETENESELDEAKTKQENKKEIRKKKLPKEFTMDINVVLGLKNFIQLFAEDGKAKCFLCDMYIDRTQVPLHLNGEHHQIILILQNQRTEKMKKMYFIENGEVDISNGTATCSQKTKETVKTLQENGTNREKIIDSLDIFQQKGVRIDLIGDKALCSKCFNDIKFSFDAIENHIKDHENEVLAKVPGEKYPVIDLKHNKTDFKRPEEANDLGNTITSEYLNKATDPETFAKENNLTYNIDHSFAFCRICQVKVPSSMNSMREHVNGNAHQTKNIFQKENSNNAEPKCVESPLYKTKPMEYFIDSLTRVENALRHDAIINDVICINVLSFMMITRNEEMLRCQVCEQNLYPNEVKEHNKTRRHERAMRITPVLFSVDSEFVREVRPDVFHCGFCNLVATGFLNLQQHLQSSAHERRKSICAWCLERYLPDVLAQREQQEEELQFATVMRWLVAGRPNFMR